MSTTLKKITTKAKQLYKSGKFAKWTDAIKAASATISKTTKKAVKKVKKTVTKKASQKVGYKKDRLDILFRSTPLIKKYRAKGWNRKDSIKNATIDAGFMAGTKNKPIAKKKALKSYHKDKKSHNTSITVISGINKTKLAIAEELKTTLRDLANSQAMYKMLRERYKTTPKEWKVEVKYAIHQQKGRIAYLKNNLTRLKSLIK
jgi:hypothetical protein